MVNALSDIRRPAVAGLFYPGDAGMLAEVVMQLLDVASDADDAIAPKALIVPHAGYMYSGPIAARGYALLRRHGVSAINRVVLIGPAHRAYVNGIAVSGADAFETPLGRVPLDVEAMRALAQLPRIVIDDDAHAHEHALEVQLPFLQMLLDDFTVVPMAVGDASGDDVAASLDHVWGGDETLVVVSSDLSHYRTYRDAQAVDARTVAAIVAGDREIDYDEACGAMPINGLVRCARSHDLVARLLDCRNSGDTAGDRSRVVGYAALAFTPNAAHE